MSEARNIFDRDLLRLRRARAASGIAAHEFLLQRVSEEIPDIIFADVYMPVMDGIDLISTLKGNPETSGIPVVMVTVMNALATEAKARELGVKHYLTKPWEKGEFDRVLDQAMRSGSPGRGRPSPKDH